MSYSIPPIPSFVIGFWARFRFTTTLLLFDRKTTLQKLTFRYVHDSKALLIWIIVAWYPSICSLKFRSCSSLTRNECCQNCWIEACIICSSNNVLFILIHFFYVLFGDKLGTLNTFGTSKSLAIVCLKNLEALEVEGSHLHHNAHDPTRSCQ